MWRARFTPARASMRGTAWASVLFLMLLGTWSAKPLHALERSRPKDSTAAASTSDSDWRLKFELGAELDPDGVYFETAVRSRDTYGRSDDALWDGLYRQFGAAIALTPAFAMVGAHVETVPIAVLEVRAEYNLFAYFGTNTALLSFATAGAPFGDNA